MKLILQAMFQPRHAAESIRSKPRWIVQFILLAITSIIITVFTHSHVVRLTLQHLPIAATAEDKFNVKQNLDRELAVRCAFLPIRLLIGWAGFALVLFYACRAWNTREAVRFRQIFSLEVAVESTLVLAQCAALIYVPFGGAIAFLKVPFGADTFMLSSGDQMLMMALNSINIFSIWYIVVLTLGVSTLYRFSKIKSCLTILAVWSLVTLFNAGIVYLLQETLQLHL